MGLIPRDTEQTLTDTVRWLLEQGHINRPEAGSWRTRAQPDDRRVPVCGVAANGARTVRASVAGARARVLRARWRLGVLTPAPDVAACRLMLPDQLLERLARDRPVRIWRASGSHALSGSHRRRDRWRGWLRECTLFACELPQADACGGGAFSNGGDVAAEDLPIGDDRASVDDGVFQVSSV